jgi:hypothetical protein
LEKSRANPSRARLAFRRSALEQLRHGLMSDPQPRADLGQGEPAGRQTRGPAALAALVARGISDHRPPKKA